ncbi:hypothetical protein M433DRAFT_139400 [Acidomyces richmondensis BFW]|nr:MAG: hypothetical protein FE78DRAFT_74866 [Acidomyces sp. 'richmondensis']KYG50181.1 hypothetical protein M433DRAFT_139400 [Acidomyces richmondensis BFW]
MEAAGAAIKDILPIPDNIDLLSSEKADVSFTLDDKPTASHALAVADHDEKGYAQITHDAEDVKNLGWNEAGDKIANPLVGGMRNEDLWILIRRFNKQMYHVKECPYSVPGNLDLNIADEEEFSPDKLRATLERLYLTVGIGMLAAVKHIVRLRSWRETRRTAAFCVAYFLAWLLDCIVPVVLLTFIVLIMFPTSRQILFPPAPIALVSAKTGGIQKPKAGVLGSTDSATGAPEIHKGEAAEAEASHFVNSIAHVALSSASGKHPQNNLPSTEEEQENTPEASVPDPTAMAVTVSTARVSVQGKTVPPHQDKAKIPMETAIWNSMRPIMHGLEDVADTWERFGNALNPTPPFPKETYRLRLAALIVPLLASSLFINNYMVLKGTMFFIGFGFFGDPVIQRGRELLNRAFPKWKKLLELRNTILKGVPTNAQLTITLLRIGEANKAPLPPPPHSKEPPPDEPVEISEEHLRATGADYPLNATDKELKAAMEHDPSVKHETTGTDIDASKEKKHGKHGARLLATFKSGAKGAVETALGADHLRAQAGNENAKQRVGVIPRRHGNYLSGPVDFKCRYHGKRGHAYVSTRATIPCVSFSLDKSIATAGTENPGDDELHPVWSVPIANIKELKKIGGFGWKAKLAVGWALNREIADGLEIVDKQGNRWVLTAMVLRDELFNRLVAMGGQKWEAW